MAGISLSMVPIRLLPRTIISAKNSFRNLIRSLFFRLFEMGFSEQLTEILSRLPASRQTLLFSATLPKILVQFAKAGLHDPVLIRYNSSLIDEFDLETFSASLISINV